MKIKGNLKKVESACWSDDRGNDKFGYVFYIKQKDNGFFINEKSKNGIFFSENYKKMLNNHIEFSCDEWGYNVMLDKKTIEKYSPEKQYINMVKLVKESLNDDNEFDGNCYSESCINEEDEDDE